MATARQVKAAAPRAEFAKSTAREYFESICVAVILALFVRTFIVQAFKIPTGSMENNLLIGDHLLVNKFVFGPTASSLERAILPIDTIKRGDVLVFKYPEDPERDFIKRVVALPGETIELKKIQDLGYDRLIVSPGVDFMFDQIERTKNEEDIYLFLEYSGQKDIALEQTITRNDVSTLALVPAFMISELRRAFEIGFLIYVPFIIIDMVIAWVLMSMGMMMLPPMMLSMPFKLIFFVLVDGWYLLIGSLAQSFSGG